MLSPTREAPEAGLVYLMLVLDSVRPVATVPRPVLINFFDIAGISF